MKHDTTERDGRQYPTPGKWALNWVEGDVISFRYDPEPDTHIHTGPTAHVFADHNGDTFGPPAFRVEVNGDEVAQIDADDYTDRDAVFDRIGDLLHKHTPDE